MSSEERETIARPSETDEGRALDSVPRLREQILTSSDFGTYLEQVGRFEMDGETWYLPWGDIPMDLDQVAFHWARQTSFPGADALRTAEPT